MRRCGVGTRRTATVVVCATALAFVGSCTSGPPRTQGGGRAQDALVVASFNFPESELVAEIYAQALERAGVPVRRELDLGPRELVMPALQQSFVDVVPEYVGSALASLGVQPRSERDASSATAREDLQRALGAGKLHVLTPSAAQNQNGVVVTRETATRDALANISNLAQRAPEMTLGGPPECPSRPFCLQGLERVYGLRFRSFVPIEDQQQEVTALEDHTIDAAVMFTTDGELASERLALLDDDRHLQPPENIVPVVSADAIARYGAQLVGALDGVSAQLTTASLRILNWRVLIGGRSAAAEARGWLARHQSTPGRPSTQ